MSRLKKKIKSFMPDRVIYLYSIIQTLPEYIESSWKARKERYPKIQFYDDTTTVDKIIYEGMSLSRFGDGEFMWMMGEEHPSFQDYSVEFANDLRKAFQSKNPKLLIGIPYGIVDSKRCNLYAKMHWKIIKSKFYSRLLKVSDLTRVYSNASITRPYIDYHDREYSRQNFENLRRIWENQDVIFVEGDKTKLGMGNDLFDNVKSIKRIICPSENAYDKIEEIKEAIIRNVKKEELILAALGPTASILACEMCELGYHFIDIGHIDIEYMWFKQHSILRDKIEGKYVNESGVKNCSDFYDRNESYVNSIIDRVL